MRGWGAVLIILGLVGIFLPLFGIQFIVVSLVADLLGISSTPASLIILGAGSFLLIVGERSLRSKQTSAFLEAGFTGASPEATEFVEAQLADASVTIDEIISHRDEHLSEEAVRKIYPFLGEILRRQITERYNVVEESIAPRAGVTLDDVGLFTHAAFKATVAQEKQEQNG